SAVPPVALHAPAAPPQAQLRHAHEPASKRRN
ncbi:hypothetical protein A2U01_0093477, partial [Trifolium medium]|nr:hypothetical protein [Trifolium medium]